MAHQSTHDRARPDARLARLLAMHETLATVSRELEPTVELQTALEIVLDAMGAMVDMKGGSICLVEGDQIRLAHSRPAVSREVLDARLPIGRGLSGWIVANAEPVLSHDIRSDPQAALQDVGSNATIRSYVGVPLVVSGTVIGLLQVDSAEIDAFDEDDLVLLRGLATQVAGSIESARRLEDVARLHRLRTDFVSRVSHELRTPVTVIAGFASTLVEYGATLDSAQLADFAQRMLGASTRLSRLVDEVVSLSSLDAGTRGLVPEQLRVREEVEDILAPTAEGAVRDELPDDLEVCTDRLVLRHALAPLVDNARRYARGGRVTGRRAGGRLVVEVVDDGPGIAPERRADLFERFTRGTDAHGGMGLGLPLADSLAGTAGGRVVHEPAGEGSCFRLVLPDLVQARDPV